jgi:hypothetical protein
MPARRVGDAALAGSRLNGFHRGGVAGKR